MQCLMQQEEARGPRCPPPPCVLFCSACCSKRKRKRGGRDVHPCVHFCSACSSRKKMGGGGSIEKMGGRDAPPLCFFLAKNVCRRRKMGAHDALPYVSSVKKMGRCEGLLLLNVGFCVFPKGVTLIGPSPFFFLKNIKNSSKMKADRYFSLWSYIM